MSRGNGHRGFRLRRRPQQGRHVKGTIENLVPGMSRRQIVELFIMVAGTELDQRWVEARRAGLLDGDELAKFNAYLDALADRLDGVTEPA